MRLLQPPICPLPLRRRRPPPPQQQQQKKTDKNNYTCTINRISHSQRSWQRCPSYPHYHLRRQVLPHEARRRGGPASQNQRRLATQPLQSTAAASVVNGATGIKPADRVQGVFGGRAPPNRVTWAVHRTKKRKLRSIRWSGPEFGVMKAIMSPLSIHPSVPPSFLLGCLCAHPSTRPSVTHLPHKLCYS